MNQTKKKVQRQERILSSLAKLTYATIEQLQVIEDLGGYRNTHRILHQMEKDKLIKSVRYEKKIYYLSNRGSERIGKGGVNLKKSWIQHTLMRNDLYIKLGMPKDWQKEVPISKEEEVYLIPDAMYKNKGEYHFVEIDNTQTMKTNVEKINKYKYLSSDIFKQYNHIPTLIWYSLSDIRKEKLKKACEKHGLKYKIY
ncbi:Replication-relaxation [Oceanobacillus limi]|uniref:Replication-relaxation n=1 Tax=Oceanobacillus limi TaxID=930131 RepID=A0A1I0HJV6_9BACI|nr:replication-relaxation family protein [Oceanobacillus limi]SET84309.1 Replication-relaxation [Oceanobacillus limi]